MKAGEVIESGMLTRQIEKAQRKVEAHNFDIRKQLLLFDDVANDQRKVVYQQRTEIMGRDDLSAAVHGIREEAINNLVDQYMPKSAAPSRLGPCRACRTRCRRTSMPRSTRRPGSPRSRSSRRRSCAAASSRQRMPPTRTRSQRSGVEVMRHVEKEIMLRMLDQHWREHLAAMDYLRQGIHLRGYAQKDYRFEYKREAFELFAAMLERVKFDTVTVLAKLEVRTQEADRPEEEERRRRLMRALQAQHAEAHSLLAPGAPPDVPAAARAARHRHRGARRCGGPAAVAERRARQYFRARRAQGRPQ